MKIMHRSLVSAIALVAVAGAADAGAGAGHTIRSAPIRLVVGFGAGGPTDIPARYVADKLGTALGQRVIVENKPAAAGMLATRDVLASRPDGYNLLFCTHFESINTAVYKNPGLQARRSRADLAGGEILLRHRAVELDPGGDFEQFVQYAKAHPGEVSYATIGAGSAQEIMARQLEKIAGISMNRIPFRGGPQVVQEMVAGRVELLRLADHRGGAAVSATSSSSCWRPPSPSRIPSLPDVPTLRRKASTTCASAGSASARRRARRSRSSTGSTRRSCRSWRRRNTAT